MTSETVEVDKYIIGPSLVPDGTCVNQCECWDAAYERGKLEAEKEIKALRLLLEWATECDFGYDQFRDEYERYKDEIQDMSYIDGMVHVAKRTLEDHGVFEDENSI